MALPVAHGLLGATVATLLRPEQTRKGTFKVLLTAAIVAIAPDLDYVFYELLGWGERWHRSFSHSILFALAVGTIAALIVRSSKTRFFMLYSLATFSHPLLDALVTEHYGGVQLLWPLSNRMFRFGLVEYKSVLRGHPTWGGILIRALKISSVELLVFGPILVAAIWLRSRLTGKAETHRLRP